MRVRLRYRRKGPPPPAPRRRRLDASRYVASKPGEQSLGWLPILFLLVCVASLGLLATVPLPWFEQTVLGLALLAVALWLHRSSRSQVVTLALMVLSVFCSVRYLWWRASETYQSLAIRNWSELRWDVVFVLALLGAELYALVMMVLGYFQSAKPLGRPPAPLPEDTNLWPTVDIFIPTYNEPVDIIAPTALAARNMDYPPNRFRVYILDDGRRPEVAQFAQDAGIGYITRPNNEHAKAGNLNNALERTDGNLVAIFDCDHVPTRSFLQMTAGWFLRDEKLALVQTPHHFYSPDPLERNLGIFGQVPNEDSLFHGVVQDGSDSWNAAFFCGSCALLRRKALDDAGGVAVETVTEDVHTSLRLQRKGWNTAYLNLVQAAGLATNTLAEHIRQRIRWARGMVQMLRIDNPLLGRGLTLPQRLCYFSCAAHYLFALPRLIFLTAPLIYLLLGGSNMYGYTVAIMAYAFPHLLLSTITNSRVQGRFRHSFWNEVYETVLAPYILLPAVLALIHPKWGKFNVTSKVGRIGRTYFSFEVAWPLLVLLILNLAAIGLGLRRIVSGAEQIGTLTVNLLWACINSLTLAAAVAAACERKQMRRSARIRARLPVVVKTGGSSFETQTADLSNGGVRVEAQSAPVKIGSAALIGFRNDGGGPELPALLVSAAGGDLRFAFRRLSLAEQEDLTRVVYGRADSWIHDRTVGQDRPIDSLLRVLRVALRGLAIAPRALAGLAGEAQRGQSSPRRYASVLPMLLVFLFLMLFAYRVVAQSPIPPADRQAMREVPARELKEFNETIDLRGLGLRKPISIEGVDGRATVPFELPVTRLVSAASLTLQFAPDAALQLEESSIAISLNGAVIGKVVLREAKAGPGRQALAGLELPAELLKGKNVLAFQLDGKCPECTPGQEPSLRTTIALSTHMRFSGRFLPLPNELHLLPSPFFDSGSKGRVNLSFAFPAAPDRYSLEAAGVVASWFGALADHRGTDLSAAVGQLPPGNVVLLVAGLSSLPQAEGLYGPAIAIRDHPRDASAKLLIIHGDTPAELLQTARTFVQGGSWSGDTAILNLVASFPRHPYDAPRWITANRFAAVGEFASGEQLRVVGAGATSLYFRLPPDLHYANHSGIPLRLNVRLGGLTAGTGVRMGIRLNGTVVEHRDFRAAGASMVLRETVRLPVPHLYPRNTLTVEFSYDGKGPTVPIEAVILRDSGIDITGIAQFVRMPRLDLLAAAGFPFTRMADLSGTAVVLPSRPTPEQIGLYLGLMGFFGAQTGIPALRVSVADPDRVEDVAAKDLLVLGSGQDQPLFSRWAHWLPVRMDSDQFLLNAPRRPYSLLAQLPVALGNERRRLSELLAGETPADAIIQAAASPFHGGHSIVTVMTPGSTSLEPLVRVLERSVHTQDVQGSLSILKGGRFHSFHLPVAGYHAGRLPWPAALDYLVRVWFWVLPIVILGLALGLAWILDHFFSRVRCTRLAGRPSIT